MASTPSLTPENVLKRDKPESTPSPNPGLEKHMNTNSSPVHNYCILQPPQAQVVQVSDQFVNPPHTPGRPVYLTNMDNNAVAVRSTYDNHTVAAKKSANPRRLSLSDGATSGDELGMGPDCPPWAKNLIIRLEKTVTDAKNSTEAKLDSIAANVASLKSDIGDVTARVNKIEVQMIEFAALPARITEVEKSAEYISKEYEDLKKDLDEKSVNFKKLESTTAALVRELDIMREKLIVHEQRSMRDNLMFMGIPEVEGIEDTEDVLHGFIQQKLTSITDKRPFNFERVHRLGGNKQLGANPRPIIAKFSRFKEREEVRTNARDLKNSSYSIRDQFSMDILQRRKILQTKLHQSREQNLYATLHRDTLRVQDKEYKVNKDGKIY